MLWIPFQIFDSTLELAMGAKICPHNFGPNDNMKEVHYFPSVKTVHKKNCYELLQISLFIRLSSV